MTFVSLIIATTLLVVLVGMIPLTVLAFRNPFRPSWMNRAGVDDYAPVVLTSAVMQAIGIEIVALMAAGFSPLVALIGTPVLTVIFGFAIWHLFDCRERLRRTDIGQSPFRRQSSPAPAQDSYIGR